MIIPHNKVAVETNIDASERASFGFSNSGALFNILIENVYSNPVLAAISETAQNAYDAHVKAGKKDVPIQITLPNRMSQNFVCRDFGNGMSHEFIMGSYVLAGESTKSSTNKQAGGFGIGKLAILTLAKTYNINVYDNGKVRMYSVFISSANGQPDIIHTGVQDTTEPNGVEINSPVLLKDIDAFPAAAQRAFKYYPVQPIVNGNVHYKQIKDEIVIAGKNWYFSNAHDNTVVCGIYSYSLSWNDITGLPAKFDNFKTYARGLVMTFENGQVMPQANRQGLFYNEKTCKAIIARLEEIAVELEKQVQALIDKEKNGISAHILFSEIFHSSTTVYWQKFGRFCNKDKINYRGQQLNNYIAVPARPAPTDEKEGSTVVKSDILLQEFRMPYRRGRYVMQNSEIIHTQLLFNAKYGVFINDTPNKKGIASRARTLLMEQKYTNVFVVTFENDKAKELFNKENNLIDSDYLSINAIVPYKNSEGDNDTPARRKHNKNVFKFKMDSNTYRSTSSDSWEIAELDSSGEGVYVMLRNFEPYKLNNVNLNSSVSNGEMDAIIKALKQAGIVDDNFTVYGIRDTLASATKTKALLDEMKEEGEWVEFHDFLTEAQKKLEAKFENLQDIVDAQYVNAAPKFFSAEDSIKLDSCKLWKQYIERRKIDASVGRKIENNKKILESLKVITRKRNLDFSSMMTAPKPSFDIEPLRKNIIEKYPMLKVITPSFNSWRQPSAEEITIIENYMKTINDCEKEKNLA